MGRKNKRKPIRELNNTYIVRPVPKHQKQRQSRCAFCGRPLPVSGWHWFTDEWGQQVKVCNDLRRCMTHRKNAAEKSYRRALQRRTGHCGYWLKEREDGYHG